MQEWTVVIRNVCYGRDHERMIEDVVVNVAASTVTVEDGVLFLHDGNGHTVGVFQEWSYTREGEKK